jgi:hypothetical protein
MKSDSNTLIASKFIARKFIGIILLLAVTLSACSKSPPPAPTTPAGESQLPAREISLKPQQIRFDRAGIATEIRVERRPATRLKARPEPGTLATPAHLLVVLDPATLPDPAVPEARALIVYPAGDWSKTYARLGRANEDPVSALRKLLDDEPKELGIEFPTAVGHTDAHEIIRSAIKYLEFHHGHGVRYLTAYQADPLPVADSDIVYVFHGLTDDGRYWVTLNLPLKARILPAPDAALAQLADYNRFIAQHTRYIADVGRRLEGARSEDFTPRLERIDAMLGSLAIE